MELRGHPLGVTVVLGVVLLVSHGGGLAAASSVAALDDAGWFWRIQQGPVSLPAPPDVEPGQLLVESAPDGAMALAALDFVVDEEDVVSDLTLEVVTERGGDGAVLLACPVGSAWDGGGARPWSDRPDADCSRSVQGQRSADGSVFVFPLDALQERGRVNVVIVPGRGAAGPAPLGGAPFRIVFAQPGAHSLRSGSPTRSSPPPTVTPEETGTPSGAGPSTTGAPTFPGPAPGSVPGELGSVHLPLDEPRQRPATDASAVDVAVPPIEQIADVDGRTTSARVLGAAAILVGVGLLVWQLSGRASPALLASSGGVGRLRRERSGESPRLR